MAYVHRSLSSTVRSRLLFGLPAALLLESVSWPCWADKVPAPVEREGDWPVVGKDVANRRFSSLNQIDTHNVSQLAEAWRFDTGVAKGHEGAPLVIGDRLYLVTPFPNRAHAFDLRRPGSGPLWTFDPRPASRAPGVACCDVVNRGPAFADGRLVFTTLDGQTIALDADSGRELWRTKLADINRGESVTMAPLIANGVVLVGNSGGEFGVRGWLTGLDLATGKQLWRAYSSGPDEDCLVDPTVFRPFYAGDRGKDLGVTSWPPERWRMGGGTIWGFLSYDPALDLVFAGTANPGAWNPELRPGDNKWSAGIFARRPRDGKAVWFYQWSPHDLYDHDGINENVLVDLPWQGTQRPLLAHADRNGYFYLLDRRTGQVLSATPFAYVNSSHGVDLKSGRLIEAPEKEPHMGRVIRDVCPAAPGAKDWQPMAYSPQTKLFYIPHNNMCEDVEGVEASYIAGTPYVGVNVRYKPGPGGHRGEFTAWDPLRAKPVWKIKETYPPWSGALATAGGLVFYGTMDGWFKAVDARTGEVLWRYHTPSGVIGQPITFLGPDEKQYIAVFSGVGGWAGSIVSNDLDPRDASASNGWGSMMSGLKGVTRKGGTLHVFALPSVPRAGARP